jgi:D-hexose-6-phosphate mutarotase
MITLNEDLSRLNAGLRYPVSNFISYREGLDREARPNGTLEAVLKSEGFETVVSDFGAHSRSLRVPSKIGSSVSRELFYLSPLSQDPTFATRGGVPIVLCQNGSANGLDTDLPMHGFARINRWKFMAQGLDKELRPFVQLVLDVKQRADLRGVKNPTWNDFKFLATISVGRSGHLTRIDVYNNGSNNTPCDVVFHTYLATSDFTKVQIRGLNRQIYQDLAASNKTELHVNGETSTIYTGRHHVQR